MILLPFLLTLAVQGPSDSLPLTKVAQRFNVPVRVFLLIAEAESGRDSARGQRARGPGRTVDGVPHTCREIGRFQINPCGPWVRAFPACRHLTDYQSNVVCGAAILRSLYRQTGSWPEAILRYNGSGPAAKEYQRKILVRLLQGYPDDTWTGRRE